MSANPANPFALLGGNRRRIRAELDRVRVLLATVIDAHEANQLAHFGGVVLVKALTGLPGATLSEVAAALRMAANVATAAEQLEAEEGTTVAEAAALLSALVAGAQAKRDVS